MIGFYNPGSGKMQKSGKLSITDNSIQALRMDLEIIGAGGDGIIVINPRDIDFGTITVGFAKTMTVTLSNKSNCNLYIELKMG
jgi:hypothetical protein